MASPRTPRATLFGRFLAFARVPLLIALGFSIASNLLFLALPIFTMQVYGRVIISQSIPSLLVLSIAALGAFSVSGIVEYLRGRLLFNLGAVFDEMTAKEVFDSAFQGAGRRDPAGQSRIIRDVDVLRTAISGPTLATLFDLPSIPLFLIALAIVDPAVAAVTAMGAGALFTMAYFQDRLSRTEVQQGAEAGFRAQSFTDATVRNTEAVFGMGMLPDLRQQWIKHRERTILSNSKSSRWSTMFSIAIRTSRMLIQIIVVTVSAWLIINHAISPSLLFVNMILVSRTLQPVQRLVGAYNGLISAGQSYGRLNGALLAYERTRKPTELPRPKGQLAVDKVSYAPPGTNALVLKSVSFRLEPGEAMGVVGPSGAGKSTLMRLLVGIWEPTGGKVRLDGHNVGHWERSAFGRHVGYLPQDTELFAGTVSENISRFRPDTPAEMVIQAAKLAGAHKMILGLPKGYDTELVENGRNLATGQRQRLGLARAVFGRPSVVILDEPNASLDAEGEHALIRMLAAMKAKGVMVIIVSHRASLFRVADKMLLLRDGMVEGFGPRQEMMHRLIPGAQQPPAEPSQAASA